MRKIWVVTKQTVLSYLQDRVLHAVLIFSVLFVFFSFFLSTLTIVEPRKILLDFGLAAISIMGVVISLFLGVTVVGKEIERRTIYTVLAKPVRRYEYLLGKFFGATLVLLLVHLLNGFILGGVLYALGENFPLGYLAANYLMVLESLLILALAMSWSLATSTLFLSAAISLAIFLIGRSSHSLRLLSEKMESPISRILARLIYDLSPSLDRFNIRELVAYSKPYPEGMVGLSTLYFAAYLMLLLGISFLLFRRKDLT